MSDRRVVETRILGLLLAARPTMLEYVRVDSCIASTKMGYEVLRYFGVPAVPRAVRMAAFNRTAWQAVEAGQVPDWEGTDAWSVAIAGQGAPQTRGGWDGHLVLLVHGRLLLDLSLDQADRPKKGIHLAPTMLLIPDPAAFTAGEWVRYEHEDGTVLGYQRLDDQGWRASRDWNHGERRYREPISRIIREINQQLGGQT
jgi:hypothetical protein